MGKRLRGSKSICSCASPRFPSASLTSFSRYDADVWTEIAKYLDGKSTVMLAATSKWFCSVLMEDSIWKFACLRDLQVPDSSETRFKWIKLYASAFGGSHAYSFREKEKHIGLALLRNGGRMVYSTCSMNPVENEAAVSE